MEVKYGAQVTSRVTSSNLTPNRRYRHWWSCSCFKNIVSCSEEQCSLKSVHVINVFLSKPSIHNYGVYHVYHSRHMCIILTSREPYLILCILQKTTTGVDIVIAV